MKTVRWVRSHLSPLWKLGLIFVFLILVILHTGELEEREGSDGDRKESVNPAPSPGEGGTVLGEPCMFEGFQTEQWNTTQRVELGEDLSPYFESVGGADCYIAGTDWEASTEQTGCVCKEKYYGAHCGIPEPAWESHYRHNKGSRAQLKPRKRPRRLIHGLQVNHEFDLFEARLESLGDVVDAYIVLESNYSSYGDPKSLLFLDKLRDCWLARFQHKLLYILLSFFPKAGETNGWYADSFLRLYLGKAGMKLIHKVRDDDIFLLLDADELPTVESLLFLKLFDGWTEPVKFGFRWTVFGFYWLKAEEPGLLASLLGDEWGGGRGERLLTLYVACTVGMLREVYGNNAMLLRRNVWAHSLLKNKLGNYSRTHAYPVEWTLGDSPHYAGHHCSWCYSPEGIRTKLTSAQRHDTPRWGDFPDKLDLGYISSLTRSGEWFDGKKPFLAVSRAGVGEAVYAPPYIRDHPHKFRYLLEPPDRTP